MYVIYVHRQDRTHLAVLESHLINSKGDLGDNVWYQGERGQIRSRPYACAESAPLGMKPAKRAGQPQSGCQAVKGPLLWNLLLRRLRSCLDSQRYCAS